MLSQVAGCIGLWQKVSILKHGVLPAGDQGIRERTDEDQQNCYRKYLLRTIRIDKSIEDQLPQPNPPSGYEHQIKYFQIKPYSWQGCDALQQDKYGSSQNQKGLHRKLLIGNLSIKQQRYYKTTRK